MRPIPQRRGAALIVALTTLLVVMLVAAAVTRSLLLSHRQARLRQNELQAEWLAEAAVSRALTQLARRPEYTGETWSADLNPAATGLAEIRIQKIESHPAGVQITVEARYPNHPTQRATARREYTLTTPAPARGAAASPSENAP
jgi:type II secretory pathway component PulK